jgi:hypothetical protein
MKRALDGREIGDPVNLRALIVRAQQYAARVMRALIKSLPRLTILEAQGNIWAKVARWLNQRAQERLYDRSRPFA